MKNLKIYITPIICIILVSLFSFQLNKKKTIVEIKGEQFYVNGKPTYEGRMWNGKKIEGLLINSRMVQGIFDDLNPDTRTLFGYPDTKAWDADRNTEEFVAAMEDWKNHGLNSFTIK